MAIAGDQSSIKSLFTAEVNYFTITGEDQSIIDRHECSHVKVERHVNEHKIVVLNQITEEETTEVFSCCIHGNMELIHSEDHIVTWSANMSTYSLEFKYGNEVRNLLSIVNELKNSLDASQTNSLTNKLISGQVLAKELHSVHGAVADLLKAKTNKNTTCLSVTHAQQPVVFEDSSTQLKNIPVSDAEVDSESEYSSAHSNLDDFNDDIPGTSAPEENSRGNMASGNETVSTIKESEVQCSETDDENYAPLATMESSNISTNLSLSSHSLEEIHDSSSAPSTGLYRKESSKANLYFHNSRGRDKGEQIELTESTEKRCYDAMVRSYKGMLDTFWSKHTAKGNKKIHKVIAALICHQEGKLPYAPVLGTGTLHRDSKICTHEANRGHNCDHCTCDGHAESIVYEGAPRYFMNEMVYLLKEEELSDSIFEKNSSNGEPLMFALKSDVKFYLMVTEPPCGFIQNQEDPCMEWKVPFVGFPHVPTCSSRILIGATMGIQGYVSHLLKEPILIDSVIILCSENAEHQRTEFGDLFSLPKIKTRKYNPKDFASFVPQNLIKRKDLVPVDTNTSTSNENVAAIPGVSTSNGTKHGSLTVASPYKDPGASYFAIDPRAGEEIPSIKHKCIEDCLSIDKSEEIKRKATMENSYNCLRAQLRLKEALLNPLHKLETAIKKKNEKITSWMTSVSTTLNNDTLKVLEESSRSTGMLDKETAEKTWVKYYEKHVQGKVHNIKEEGKSVLVDKAVISCIEDILSNEKRIIMDCTWECYFKSPDKTQPEND